MRKHFWYSENSLFLRYTIRFCFSGVLGPISEFLEITLEPQSDEVIAVISQLHQIRITALHVTNAG